MFGGEKADQFQAVYDALHACAEDQNPTHSEEEQTENVYRYMENTPRTSFTVELVQKLHEMGFEIKKVKKNP
jgi:hypothetical protein